MFNLGVINFTTIFLHIYDSIQHFKVCTKFYLARPSSFVLCDGPLSHTHDNKL
jgi:hypothetical protein